MLGFRIRLFGSRDSGLPGLGMWNLKDSGFQLCATPESKMFALKPEELGKRLIRFTSGLSAIATFRYESTLQEIQGS